MKPWIKSVVFFATLAGLAISCDDESFWDSMIPETDGSPTATQIQAFVYKPAVVPATDANVQQLKVPAGFTVNKFAEALGNPRMLAVSSTGQVYATDREAGTVMMLQDTNGDGVADDKKTVASLRQVHGLAIRQARMYMVTVREVYVADMNRTVCWASPSC